MDQDRSESFRIALIAQDRSRSLRIAQDRLGSLRITQNRSESLRITPNRPGAWKLYNVLSITACWQAITQEHMKIQQIVNPVAGDAQERPGLF